MSAAGPAQTEGTSLLKERRCQAPTPRGTNAPEAVAEVEMPASSLSHEGVLFPQPRSVPRETRELRSSGRSAREQLWNICCFPEGRPCVVGRVRGTDHC